MPSFLLRAWLLAATSQGHRKDSALFTTGREAITKQGLDILSGPNFDSLLLSSLPSTTVPMV